jgi:hypothetical protein
MPGVSFISAFFLSPGVSAEWYTTCMPGTGNGQSQNGPGGFNPESMLKGRMAETLVEELLKKSGNTVYRFGYEAILQNLTQLQKSFDFHSDAGERIRAIPDFIVIDTAGNPVFVEVKFRRDGDLYGDDVERLKRIRDLWRASVIIVNCTEKPFFRVTKPEYFDEHGDLDWKTLAEETAWKIDAALYDEYEELVTKYLGAPLTPAAAAPPHEEPKPHQARSLEVDLRNKT